MRSLGAVITLFSSALVCWGSQASHADAQTVVIDPGHGGADPGAVGCSLEEEDIVLDVSLQAAAILRGEGLTVLMTRDDDRFIELSARSSFANSSGAVRFVSVHANSNEGTPATGTETFVYTSPSAASVTLGQAVQDDLIATWGLRDRGLKMANFSVLRNTTMPAALAELGFVNRCDPDAALLGSAAERTRIAAALARAILASLGRTDPIDPPTGTGRLLGASFEDVGVGLEDTTNRIAGARVQVGDEVQTSGDDGLFMFDLDPGTYQVQVSMDGFAPAMRECVVSAGADTWCSVGLSPAAPVTMTRVVGFVFEENGEGMMTAPRLGGATVDYGEGMSVTTDDEGGFEFEVAPGDITLTVSKDGYEPSVRACAASGAETWCYVGLVPMTEVGNGTLQGVVHVAGELNRRIENATVLIRELGTTVQSAEASGFWRLELPAGTYTVDIEAMGYVSASAECTVIEGDEAWCTVGLARDGDGGASVIDERSPEEVARGVEPISGGCSASGIVSGSGSSAFWLLGVLGLLLLRRRRAAHGAAAVAASLLVLTGCSGAPEAAALSTQAPLATPHPSDGLLLAAEVPSFVALENIHEVAEGDFVDLELSPDARNIALSHARYDALSVVELDTDEGEPHLIHRAPQAGYEPRWRADGQAIGVRTEGQTSTAAPMLAFTLNGTEVDPFQPAVALSVRVEDDAIVMRTQDGDETRLGPPGDRYFEPRASAGGEFVSFRGLSTGLYIHRRADGATFMVGAGDHARFDSAGRWMVFARSTEDGHERTGAALYVVDLASAELRYGPIETNAVRADAPSIAGGKVAFMDEGSVRIGALRFED